MKLINMDTHKNGCLYPHSFIADFDSFTVTEKRKLISGGSIINPKGDEVSVNADSLKDIGYETVTNCFNPKGITVADLEKLGLLADLILFHIGDDTFTIYNSRYGVKKATYVVDEPDDTLDYYHWEYTELAPEETRLLASLIRMEIVKSDLTFEFESDGTADVLTKLVVWTEDNT